MLAVEEPLEIRINGVPVAVTMRTPGHDEELALGFCLSEGLRPGGCAPPGRPGRERRRGRRARVRPGAPAAQLLHVLVLRRVRERRARSGRGRRAARREPAAAHRTTSSPGCPTDSAAAQPAFAATGGLHATGLFDARGELLALREDVGRHNAFDKVVGWAFTRGLPSARRRARSASAAACRSSSSRRRPLPAARSSSPSALRRASPSSSPPTAGSRSAASSAAAASTSTRSRGGSAADGRPARRRRQYPLRLAQGSRRASTA